MEEELSLRDIADILARYRTWLIAAPLVCAAAAFAYATLGEHTYTSRAVLSINTLNTLNTPNSSDDNLLNSNLLPGAPAIASGYENAAVGRLARAWNVGLRDVQKAFTSAYDEKSNTVTLSAQAATPAAAQLRAERAEEDFRQYVDGVVTDVIGKSFGGRVQQARLDIEGDRFTLHSLRASLAGTPRTLPGSGQASARDALASAGVDRRFAGSSDAPANPAYAYLAVKIAETETRVSVNQAFVQRWEQTLNSPQQLLTLARQATQLNTLSGAALPLTPDGPGRLILTVLGALLGGVLGVLIAFVHHALRRSETARSVRTLQHGD